MSPEEDTPASRASDRQSSEPRPLIEHQATSTRSSGVAVADREPPRRHHPDTDVVDPLLRCPICLDHFIDMVTLPCLHNICRSHVADLACLQQQHRGCEGGDDAPFHGDTDATVSFRCPKCRAPHRYDSLSAVRVNYEMQAVVDMVKGLMAGTPSQGVAARGASSHATSSVIEAGAPGENPGRRVAFLVGEAASPSPPVTTAPGGARARGRQVPTSLSAMEQRLASERAVLLTEKVEANRQKAEAFKKARQDEIFERKRQWRLATTTVDEEEFDEDDSVEQPRLSTAHAPSARRGATEACRDEDDDARASRLALEWLSGGIAFSDSAAAPDGPNPTLSVGEHVRRLAAYEQQEGARGASRLHESSPPGNVVGSKEAVFVPDRAEMCRLAESRLPTQQQQSPPRPTIVPSIVGPHHVHTTRPLPPRLDMEVEQALLDAERRFLRVRDDELTRAQMADIAEKRAREMLQQYYKRQADAVPGFSPQRRPMTSVAGLPLDAPIKPSYTPKLERLRTITLSSGTSADVCRPGRPGTTAGTTRMGSFGPTTL